jgi:pilus assembly protein Flp/PilA
LRTLFTNLIKDESGVTAIEYALIGALLAVLLVTALTTLQGSLSGTFAMVASCI